jgi:2-keto-4-pentenoate hydratase/2-oxohepta-3-ene-1,7-dioic acid hydratase in catechol pathway
LRAVRYTTGAGEARIGRLEDDHVVDAGPAGVIGFDASPEAWAKVAAASGESVAADAVRLLHPVVPRKLIGIGLNYRDHAAESQLDIPAVPVVFAKFGSSLTGHGETIVVPREETRPDYEGEVGVVIGRRTYRADAAAARAAVGGLTAVNDVSGRRAQL